MIWLQLIHFNRYFLIIWVLYLWCITRFGISHYLAFVWLFECMQMHANAFFYLHVVAWVSMAFERVYQMSNVWMPFKWVNTNNLMTFEWCFLISKHHENCNAISSFTVLHHVSWKKFFLQCRAIFSLVCYGFHLVMLQVMNTACWNSSGQESVPRSLQLKKYCYLQE